MNGWAACAAWMSGSVRYWRYRAPVVVERLALVQRVERPADVGAGRLRLGRRVRRLVDRVAEVEDGVEIVAFGEATEGVEEARVELGARHLAETEPGDLVGRERPRPPDLRVFAVGLEAVLVAVSGFELVDVDGDASSRARPAP